MFTALFLQQIKSNHLCLFIIMITILEKIWINKKLMLLLATFSSRGCYLQATPPLHLIDHSNTHDLMLWSRSACHLQQSNSQKGQISWNRILLLYFSCTIILKNKLATKQISLQLKQILQASFSMANLI